MLTAIHGPIGYCPLPPPQPPNFSSTSHGSPSLNRHFSSPILSSCSFVPSGKSLRLDCRPSLILPLMYPQYRSSPFLDKLHPTVTSLLNHNSSLTVRADIISAQVLYVYCVVACLIGFHGSALRALSLSLLLRTAGLVDVRL